MESLKDSNMLQDLKTKLLLFKNNRLPDIKTEYPRELCLKD